MIGVICKKKMRRAVEECFELFKTPWEFYREGQDYDVLMSTEAEIHELNARLLVIYGSEEKDCDKEWKICRQSCYPGAKAEHQGLEVPLYMEVATFHSGGQPLMVDKRNGEMVALAQNGPHGKVIRVGFDLFNEIQFLLSQGQPAENAFVPTLELHLSILKTWIVKAGIPLVEIPPVPEGYRFITCLTHDVDFAGIKKHKFDRTMWGFLYRALMVTPKDLFQRRTSWDKLLKNLKAVLFLPFVFAGLTKDFWVEFDKYMEIEKDTKSTFFVIPFKNRMGDTIAHGHGKARASKYDIADIKKWIQEMQTRGFEIGVHGIDGWHSVDKAQEELERIRQFTDRSTNGVRMHWLYFNESTFEILAKAGYIYDSSFGYNEAVGYRAGTMQVFRNPSANGLDELPMIIQDTTLLGFRRMRMSEKEASEACKDLLDKAETYGGAVTINWHMRSLSPERLWGDFYVDLLKDMKSRHVWFGTAMQVVEWFRRRRSLVFEERRLDRDHRIVKCGWLEHVDSCGPGFMLRIHKRKNDRSLSESKDGPGGEYVDVPLRPGEEIVVGSN